MTQKSDLLSLLRRNPQLQRRLPASDLHTQRWGTPLPETRDTQTMRLWWEKPQYKPCLCLSF